MRYAFFLIITFFQLFIFSAYAQHDMQTLKALAEQAKNSGELDKAIDYYSELYQKANNDNHYNQLFQLLVTTERFEEADKLTKKRIRKYPNLLELKVNRAYLIQLSAEEKDAIKAYEEIIDDYQGNVQQAYGLANRFNQYNLFEYAEKTYKKAIKESGDDKLFQTQLANSYAQQGKTAEMIEVWLDIVGDNRSYLQSVQNIFQRVLRPDPEGKQMEALRTQLLKRVQQNNAKEIYSELLMWLYIQDKNFRGAFLQAKAFDRRGNENGQRLISLGQLANRNGQFAVAEEAYNYIIALGEESPYYLRAKMSVLEVMKSRIFANSKYSREDLLKLKAAYQANLNDLGKSAYTLEVMRNLAELDAYYLGNIDTAIIDLESVLAMRGISKQDLAKVKIELADLYLLNDDIWEASLLYSQVEKDFKYDAIGETAKFKNAKVAFYTGDFYWAQAQLDVLKGSTSKLIANDALDLSLLITDNIGLDSIAEPLEMYARGDLLVFKKDFKSAEATLDSIPKFFPATSLKDEVLFKKFKIDQEQRNYEAAAAHLEDLLANYPEDLLGDDALFSLAQLYEYHLNDRDKAQELYKKLIFTFPSSLYVVESRKRFRSLRGDNEIKEEEFFKGNL